MLLALYLSTLHALEAIVSFLSPILSYVTVFVLGLLVGRSHRHGRRRGWLF